MNRVFGFLFACLILLASCKTDDTLQTPFEGFPKEVGEILINRCATSGCHNAEGALAANGLDLSSWDKLFQGSNAGAAVVPYRADYSFLTHFINTDPDSGIVEAHTPILEPPLTADEVKTISDWIDQGAPDYQGIIKWENENQAYYVANQGCDLLAKINPATGLIMRYIELGQIPLWKEAPHMIKMSPNKDYIYAIFLSNNPFVEVYSTATDSLVAQAQIGTGDWNTITISPYGKYAYCVAFNGKKVAIANLEDYTFEGVINTVALPHGSAVAPDFSYVYVTQQIGNYIYKYEIGTPPMPEDISDVSVEQTIPSPNGSGFNTYEIEFTPDGSKYLVTCHGTHEVRIFNTANDSLLAAIQVGEIPSEIVFYNSQNLAFVTCMEDISNFPGQVGSVAVIDYENLSLVKHIHTGTQPHGLSIDERLKVIAVANRNQDPSGPDPHHLSPCGTRNGYLTLIDLNTLEMVPDFKKELAVDPYSVVIK